MYGTYETHWWAKVDDDINCSPEDIAEVLQYSLAAMQYSPSDNEQYNLHYDTTWSLAYALNDVIKSEEYYENPLIQSEISGSGYECNYLLGYKLRGFAPMLMRRYLLVTNFTGLSVSTLPVYNTAWISFKLYNCWILGSDYF